MLLSREFMKLHPTHREHGHDAYSMATHEQNTFSIWLRPCQTQIDEITNIISELSHRFDSTPFPPHITLLSNLSIDATHLTKVCKKMFDQHVTFNIPLKQIEYTDNYYRNLYILAELNQPLLNIYEETKTQLSYKAEEIFTPHLSLYYGKLTNKKQRALKEELSYRYPKFLTCNRLDLYCTSGKENEWHLIDSFNLKNN